MRANSDVLVALATYAQRWNLEGLVVAERMRRDGLALRRAVVGIGLGMTCGYGKRRVSSYVHEAASAYYLMRLRLLALYETSHAARYPSFGGCSLGIFHRRISNPPVTGRRRRGSEDGASELLLWDISSALTRLFEWIVHAVPVGGA